MKPLLRFCRSVVPDTSPVFVAVRTEKTAEQNECFENVRLHVEAQGGEAVHGWAIWEWPKVYFEAEFHCVWKSPSGDLIDITPNVPPYPWILFLPDPRRVYKDRLIDNQRKALMRDPVLDKFYDVCRRWYQLKAPQYEPGFVESPEWYSKMEALYHERLACDRKMLERFGHLLTPVIQLRLTSPMPTHQ